MVKDKVTTKLEYFEKLWSSKNEVALLNALGMSNPPDGLSYLLRNKEKSNVKIVNYNTRSEANFVFVVPTANVDNKTSTDLRKQLKELPSIFVESTGENFNYAHSCNTGISEALNAGYNWIIICNDDIKFQESPHNLEKFINESNKLTTFFLTEWPNVADPILWTANPILLTSILAAFRRTTMS